MDAPRLCEHALGVAGPRGVQLAERVAVRAVRPLVNRADLFRRISRNEFQKRLCACFRLKIVAERHDLRVPEFRLGLERAEGQDRVRRHAGRAAPDRQLDLIRVAGVVPPPGRGALVDPLQIVHIGTSAQNLKLTSGFQPSLIN